MFAVPNSYYSIDVLQVFVYVFAAPGLSDGFVTFSRRCVAINQEVKWLGLEMFLHLI